MLVQSTVQFWQLFQLYNSRNGTKRCFGSSHSKDHSGFKSYDCHSLVMWSSPKTEFLFGLHGYKIQSRCSENVCSPSYFFYRQLPVILVPSKNVLSPLRTLGGSSSMISLASAALVGLVSGTSYLKPKERIKKYQGMRSDGKHTKTQNRHSR